MSWIICHLVFETKFTTLPFYKRILDRNIAQRCKSIWLLPILLLFLTNDSLIWTTGEKIEVFNYFNLLTTKTHLKYLILTNIDICTFIKYNLRCTQEFGDCYVDDWFILLKELQILKYSETGHFAYSVLAMRKGLFDLLPPLILRWDFSKLCHLENMNVFLTQPFEISRSVQNVADRFARLCFYRIESFLHIQIALGRSMTAMKFNFVDFTYSRTEGSFLNQCLTVWNRNMSKEYHPHSTQGFPRQYLDELLTFLKEIHFNRNGKDGHFAYSYPQKPCIVIDWLALDLDPKVLSTFCDNEFGAKFERY